MRGLIQLCARGWRRLAGSSELRRSLAAWSAAGLLLSEALAIGVAQLRSGRAVAVAAVATAGWWLLLAVVLAAGAALLETPDGRLVQRYGVPNGLSVLRAWFCAPIMLIALLPVQGRLGLALWAGVGGAVGLLDLVDGIVARSIGPITVLGKALDPLTDVLFFITAAWGCYLLGITPLWLSLLIVARYGVPLALTPAVFLAGRRPELVHTSWGRRNTALIGLVLFVLFCVRLATGPVALVALIVALPLLLPTLALHLLALAQRVARAPAR